MTNRKRVKMKTSVRVKSDELLRIKDIEWEDLRIKLAGDTYALQEIDRGPSYRFYQVFRGNHDSTLAYVNHAYHYEGEYTVVSLSRTVKLAGKFTEDSALETIESITGGEITSHSIHGSPNTDGGDTKLVDCKNIELKFSSHIDSVAQLNIERTFKVLFSYTGGIHRLYEVDADGEMNVQKFRDFGESDTFLDVVKEIGVPCTFIYEDYI